MAYAKQWMTRQHAMSNPRHARLFRNGRNQAIRIPREMELPGEEVLVRKEGGRLIIEPIEREGLLPWLHSLAPLDQAFPDVDQGLTGLDDPDLADFSDQS